MGSTLLDLLTADGQIAFVLAAVILTSFGMILMLWRPRHATYRPHDCRSLGCQWLEDKPRP
jgi:hypothetical protein